MSKVPLTNVQCPKCKSINIRIVSKLSSQLMCNDCGHTDYNVEFCTHPSVSVIDHPSYSDSFCDVCGKQLEHEIFN